MFQKCEYFKDNNGIGEYCIGGLCPYGNFQIDLDNKEGTKGLGKICITEGNIKGEKNITYVVKVFPSERLKSVS